MKQQKFKSSFTISEVAADWHELMIPWHIMWPSIACAKSVKLDCSAGHRHTTTPISHTTLSLRRPSAATYFLSR